MFCSYHMDGPCSCFGIPGEVLATTNEVFLNNKKKGVLMKTVSPFGLVLARLIGDLLLLHYDLKANNRCNLSRKQPF